MCPVTRNKIKCKRAEKYSLLGRVLALHAVSRQTDRHTTHPKHVVHASILNIRSLPISEVRTIYVELRII